MLRNFKVDFTFLNVVNNKNMIKRLKLRKKLKDIVDKLNVKSGMGVIVRTAGQVMGLKEIKRDYGSLIKLWNEITSKTIKSNAPCLIHEEDNIIKRSLRDYFDSSFDEIIINDNFLSFFVAI